MNEIFPSSAGVTLAPIPAPDDHRVLPHGAAHHSFATAFGHFLLFGFYGQIAYTVIELGIAASTYGRAEAPASVMWQLLLLILPVLCAVRGATAQRATASSKAGHPLAIVSLSMAMGALGIFNLLVLFATMMTGYC